MQHNLIKILVITLGFFVGICQAADQLVKESDRSARKYRSVTRPDTGIDLASLDDCVDQEPLQVNKPSVDACAYYRALGIRLRKYWLDSATEVAESPTPENIQKHLEITELLVSAASDVNRFLEDVK